MKKIFWIAMAVLIIIGLIFLLINVLTIKDNTEVVNENNIRITDFELEDRTIIKTNKGIYVGSNEKELENNFYDIRITNTENTIHVYLNKLWYETYGKDYIQDDYLARICRELANRLNVDSEAEQFEYVLYKYVKDNYIKVRQNELIDEMLMERFSLKLELEDDIVKLIIRSI